MQLSIFLLNLTVLMAAVSNSWGMVLTARVLGGMYAFAQ